MAGKRHIYLDMKTVEEARGILFSHFPGREPPATETVSPPDAVGRVLAEPVFAGISSPSSHLAAMDGVAVDAQSTFGASEIQPKALTVGETAFHVNTGNVLPPGANAVIMIEHVHAIGEDRIEIEAPVFPWQHVRRVGEDVVATELLFARNHVVTPYCVGALIAAGSFSVTVRTRPRVMIIPTGSELVDWREAPPGEPEPGQVFESNSYALGGLTEAGGGSYVRHEPVADELGEIRRVVRDAALGESDIILLVGGSSAGSKDYSRQVISELGDVLVHGVTMMPGKPLIVGKIDEKAIFGIPGYPVSAILAFEQFVSPLMCRMLETREPQRERVQVAPTRTMASKLGVEEFVRVRIGKVADKMVATPLPRGAGCITSLSEADAIIRIPNHVEGITEHEQVPAELLRPLAALRDTIVIVGSHDNTLDILADEIRAHHCRFSVASSHVGSMGGLMAIKRGVCHLAGSHLLDPVDGSYNTSYIGKYLPHVKVRQVNLVCREQGLIVAQGNPKGIQSIGDLARDDVAFINRQPGSGTRILFDFRLQSQGISPDEIDGYRNEEYTHMAVAVAVASGTVDVGLGIYAAAAALGLDFVPIATEPYELIVPQKHLESERIQKLLAVINSNRFKQRVAKMGGYSTDQTGLFASP